MGKKLLLTIDFELLFESLPGAYIVLLPDDFKIAAVSDAYLSATQTTRAELVGRNLFDVFPGSSDDIQITGVFSLENSLKNVISNREADTMAVQRYDIRKSGGLREQRFRLLSNKPVFNTKNEIEFIIHSMEDVTDFVRTGNENERITKSNEELERKIMERTSQLQAVNKELESFSYSVSHDLRAPLRAVDGYSKIVVEDYADSLDEEGKRLLGVVQYNARKMGELIDDLLTFSRLGKKELQKTTINMTELTEGAVIELSKTIDHGAEIRINSMGTVRGDYSLMNQVMVNLISNAVKYSSKTVKPVVEISSSEKNNEVTFTVKDNGVGFNMQYAHKLFGVFQRLHLSEEFDGTGVGLAVVHRIISKHGGRVWAEGDEGKGASFHFTLPVEKI